MAKQRLQKEKSPHEEHLAVVNTGLHPLSKRLREYNLARRDGREAALIIDALVSGGRCAAVLNEVPISLRTWQLLNIPVNILLKGSKTNDNT